jgi:hypothetical protein
VAASYQIAYLHGITCLWWTLSCAIELTLVDTIFIALLYVDKIFMILKKDIVCPRPMLRGSTGLNHDCWWVGEFMWGDFHVNVELAFVVSWAKFMLVATQLSSLSHLSLMFFSFLSVLSSYALIASPSLESIFLWAVFSCVRLSISPLLICVQYMNWTTIYLESMGLLLLDLPSRCSW